MLRNPLVAPEVLGVASGAAFGGAVAILAGLSAGTLQLMAFAGGLFAALLALGIARAVRTVSPTVLVLAGVGVIGWVGLVVPHMARSLVGPGFARLLAASVLLGAGFLLIVEDVAHATASIELPLGILTAPFFVLLLVRAGRQWL